MTSEVRRDVATGLTLALAMASMAMTVIDRTKGSAKTAEQLEGRVNEISAVVADQRAILKARGRFVNDATNQLNFLCTTAQTCRQIYAPIVVPE